MPSIDRLRTLFNDSILKFSKDLRIILSDNEQALGYLEALDTMVGVSPDLVSGFFKEHIADPYQDMILSRNEDFLKSDLMERFGSGPFAEICNEIHHRWTSLKDSERNTIWDYFKVLTKISQKLSA